jgi:DNA-binding NtrC family response regulator
LPNSCWFGGCYEPRVVITLIGGDRDVRSALTDIFRLEAWRTISIGSIGDALRRLDSRELELDSVFLIDADVFGTDAEQLLGRLRGTRPILLGHSERCRALAKSRGAFYVEKPFDVEELLDTVRAVSVSLR